ncbi:MAG: patatin-like phospholipase family protein [Solirubrobacteraceae bacterium]
MAPADKRNRLAPGAPRAGQAISELSPTARPVAFVLGGGGLLGAYEVGMLRALVEHGIRPDLVLGTSVGAVNGAVLAAAPDELSIRRLEQMWLQVEGSGVFGGSVLGRLGRLARTRNSLHSAQPLREVLAAAVSAQLIEDLAVPVQCVAASIEHACEHWFSEGPLADAVLASCAVPGLLPPVAIDGEHFIDGGVVNSIPVGRAVELGARVIHVLQVGRVDQPLHPPSWPWEAGLVAFEIARRHRYTADMAQLPDDVEVHVLPTGGEPDAAPGADLKQLRYRNFAEVPAMIERAYNATATYLDGL